MAQFYAIYEKATGRLVSQASVVAPDEVLDEKGLEAKPIAEQAPAGKLWNTATKAFDLDAPPSPKSEADKLAELVAAVEAAPSLAAAKAAAAAHKAEISVKG